jgi:hypothetical protein
MCRFVPVVDSAKQVYLPPLYNPEIVAKRLGLGFATEIKRS